MCFFFSFFFSFLPHLHSLHSERALWWLHSQALSSKGKQIWGACEAWIQFPLTCVCADISQQSAQHLSPSYMRAQKGHPEMEKHRSECTDSPNTTQEHEAENNLLMLNSISLVSSPAYGTQLFHHVHVPTSTATHCLRATPFTFWVGQSVTWVRKKTSPSSFAKDSEPFRPENSGCHFYCFLLF